MNVPLQLEEREYHLIRDLVYTKFGINLGAHKQALVAGRLNKIVRQHGFPSFMDYYTFLVSDDSGTALRTLVNRISTNHTYFNRESGHFEYLESTVLPALRERLVAEGDRHVRIWSAGCSSGEESYTLAMLLLETFGKEAGEWRLGVLATDISEVVLEKARAGLYSDENVQKLPDHLRRRYFQRGKDGMWTVSPAVRDLVLYRRLNLIRERFPFKRRFHAIFCRNVMIYFDAATRAGLVQRFSDCLEPGGHLFIGHSESLGRGDARFNYLRPALYQKI